MTEVFISADTIHDGEYAKILKKELEDTYLFSVHLIVYDHRPATDLVNEIKKSIDSSTYFLPILTEKSMLNQWVNQEIGYAVAKANCKIFPLVERKIIDDLRGFITLTLKLDHNFEFVTNPLEMNDTSIGSVKTRNMEIFKSFAQNVTSFLKEKDSPIYVTEITDWSVINDGKIYEYSKRAVLIRKGFWHWIHDDQTTQYMVKIGGVKYIKKAKLDERKYPKGKVIYYERPVPQPPAKNPFES